MYKPPIFNRYIHVLTKNEENEYLVNKLNNVKSTVDVKCPESFDFYHGIFKKNKTLISFARASEIKHQNQILVGKIVSIFNKNKSKEKPFQQTDKGKFKQNSLKRIIDQDNKFLNKKIENAKAYYNNKKLQDDFRKSRSYKKNLTEFSILEPLMTVGSLHKHKYLETCSSLNDTLKSTGKVTTGKTTNKSTGKNTTTSSKRIKNTNLFNKNMFIENYGYSNVDIKIEGKDKLTIEIKLLEDETVIYQLLFSKSEDITIIKNSFYKFEELLYDLSYENQTKRFNFKRNTFLNSKFVIKIINNTITGGNEGINSRISELNVNQEESIDRGADIHIENNSNKIENNNFKHENFQDIEERDADYLENKFENEDEKLIEDNIEEENHNQNNNKESNTNNHDDKQDKHNTSAKDMKKESVKVTNKNHVQFYSELKEDEKTHEKNSDKLINKHESKNNQESKEENNQERKENKDSDIIIEDETDKINQEDKVVKVNKEDIEEMDKDSK